jgi:uncharacterized membrane protein YbhN (UPF0104 family)
MKRPGRIAMSAASLLAAGALLVALPYVVGVHWSEIGGVLGQLNPAEALWLVALWLAGLWSYTWVLTASLPGLTHVRAFAVNAAGSLVSNVLPFGGALGVAVTFAMCRSWGHGNATVTVSTLITGVWNMLAKLLLPAVGIAALLVAGQIPDRRLGSAAGFGGALLVAIVVACALALRSETAAARLQNLLVRLAERLPVRLRKPARRIAESILRVRHQTVDVLRTGWLGLTLGTGAYLLLQGMLLAACLAATGAHIGLAETIAVFALNRLLTVAVITPSGTGISETGTAALLVHFGAPSASAAAAVLLYMVFVHTLEIPLGGLAAGIWAFTRRPPRLGPVLSR